MSWMPFICLGIGFLVGIILRNKQFLRTIDKISTLSLACLMLSIGLGIGIDRTVLERILTIGFNCFVISLSAIFFSVVLTVFCEKTVLPLKRIDEELSQRKIQLKSDLTAEGDESKLLVWIMPICIVLGLVAGTLFRKNLSAELIEISLTICLVILYTCVGIAQGSNKEVYQFIKILGFRVIFISVAILLGSIAGGYLAGLILGLPRYISTIAASGMSYYSITGAFMTESYGLEIGAYGFLVNVMREFITILLLPLLIKISMGSPIAGGAAGNMDVMLAPVTKFVGIRLGLVTLVTGTVLTFLVPFLLPILASVFSS